MCAFWAKSNAQVTLFDFSSPLHTLLYTGGGRCNLAYLEYDFKELAKFYPRGEKFLYSVFSKFCTGDTLSFFEKIGVKTYAQEDLRIFPASNSAQDVKNAMLKALSECKFKKERVLNISNYPASPLAGEACFQCEQKFANIRKQGEGNNKKFIVKTDKNEYEFDKVVIAVGGHSGFTLAKNLGHKIVEPKPSLTGLITKENFRQIQGVSLKNINADVIARNEATKQSKNISITGDMIFTHEGISGPLAYKISSICAREDYSRTNPLKINLNIIKQEINLQKLLDENSKKDIKNLISEFVPKSLAEYILETNGIAANLKCHQINGKIRDLIYKSLNEFEANVISPAKEGEVVTSGGVSLDEINPKTMESKLVEGMYFCGEVIDVDGFCGGYNLQNCWSSGFVAGVNL